MTQTATRLFKVLDHAIDPVDYLRFVATENIAFHFGQSAEDTVLVRLFEGQKDGFYVDVGAFHPRLYSNTFLLHHLFNWRGINIDASQASIDLFNHERPRDINVCLGVGIKPAALTFHTFNHPARNTFSATNLKRQLSKGDTTLLTHQKIAVKPLADILTENLPANQTIDLMNIDIEGFDLQALESNNWDLYRPRVILIEDYTVNDSKHQASKIFLFLKKKGYIFHSQMFDTSLYVEKSFKVATIPRTVSTKKGFTESLHSLITSSSQSNERADYLSAVYTGIWIDLKSQSNAHKLESIKKVLKDKQRQNHDTLEKLIELRTQKRMLEHEVSVLEDTKNYYAKLLAELLQSRAWRYTVPLRDIRSAVKKFSKGSRS